MSGVWLITEPCAKLPRNGCKLKAKRQLNGLLCRFMNSTIAQNETAPHLVIAVTSGTSGTLMRGQLAAMKQQGFRVTLVAGPDPLVPSFIESEGVDYVAAPMAREIAPLHDLKSLLHLIGVIRRLRPDIINAGTPKAGLLVTIAAAICRVPCRIYTMRGLRLETATGPKRSILTLTEKVSCRLAHRVVCVGHALRERALELRLTTADKAVVLGSGSSNGIDTTKFCKTDEWKSEGAALRERIGIPSDAIVIGFVGRLVRDKGIVELVEAWQALRSEYPNLHLLLVGGYESGDPVPAEIAQLLETEKSIHLGGLVAETRSFYAAMDIFVLPSYREGFANVLLEASAMELPVVTTTAPGCIDGVQQGETGYVVAPCDSHALAEAMRHYIADPALRERHGKAGRERVERAFRREIIWEGQAALYQDMLAQRRGKSGKNKSDH
jgi:glycosyltransferase involved in cell wall biosynthesis